MSRSQMLALAAAASLAVPVIPVVAQQTPAASADSIIVNAPRRGPRDARGEPTEMVTHSTKVSLAGIDLSTPAGLQALEPKVRAAAKKSCGWLDAHYPVVDTESDCEKTAVDDAMARARTMTASR